MAGAPTSPCMYPIYIESPQVGSMTPLQSGESGESRDDISQKTKVHFWGVTISIFLAVVCNFTNDESGFFVVVGGQIFVLVLM